MCHLSTLDIFTAFSKLLALSARFSFQTIFLVNGKYELHCTNFASYFVDLIVPGKMLVSITFGKLRYHDLDNATRQQLNHYMEKHNNQARLYHDN